MSYFFQNENNALCFKALTGSSILLLLISCTELLLSSVSFPKFKDSGSKRLTW